MDEQYSSVWDALEPTPEDAAKMKRWSQMRMALSEELARSRQSQASTHTPKIGPLARN